MIWKACLLASFACLCTGYAFALRYIIGKAYKTGNALYPAFMGVISASVFIFIPIFNGIFAGDAWSTFKCIMISIHSAIRLFMVDGEFTNVRDAIEEAGITSGALYKLYTSLAAILFVNAPLLTFGFIFSFLRKLNDNVRYMFGVRKHCYVFSDLNERSITLAEDLHAPEKKKAELRKKLKETRDKEERAKLKKEIKRERQELKENRCQIVFTDVFHKDSEESSELFERAEKIGAVCFNKDILDDIPFDHFLRKGKKLYFFIIGSHRSENLTQALKLIEKYNDRDNTRLFYFSDDENSDLQFSSIDKGKIKVKRVNMARVLIDHELYNNGYKLFLTAKEEPYEKRHIRAVIVGVGRHGSNMLKSLSWFCQMEGYELEIDAFDKDPLAQEKLELQCPDLISGKYNGKKDADEAIYTINIHPSVDVETKSFANEIENLPKTNYVIVALGDDERNLRVAVMLRCLFTRMGKTGKVKIDNKEYTIPRIQTIVYNSNEKEALAEVKNFSGDAYEISFFGDMCSTYCCDVIINSELEAKALAIHKGYCYKGKDPEKVEKEKPEEARQTEYKFWMQEYNYRSSIATAIHSKACKELESRGLHHDKDVDEHRRWNAYLRSEGYIQKGRIGEKNHLAKTHGDLVGYSVLYGTGEEKKDKDITDARE